LSLGALAAWTFPIATLSTWDRYFDTDKMETSEEWIMNPYSFNLDKMSDDGKLKESLTELCSNRALEMQFHSKILEECWSGV